MEFQRRRAYSDGLNLHDTHVILSLDELERGDSRELLFAETESPSQYKKEWKFYYIKQINKQAFYMHDEQTGSIILTAKVEKNTVYISQYEDFPSTFALTEEAARGKDRSRLRTGYCATLQLNERTGTVTLYKKGATCATGIFSSLRAGRARWRTNVRYLL